MVDGERDGCAAAGRNGYRDGHSERKGNACRTSPGANEKGARVQLVAKASTKVGESWPG